MKSFKIHFITLILLTIIDLFNAQIAQISPPTQPSRVINCTHTRDCPHWSCSCIEEYKKLGGTSNNISELEEKKSCCICSATDPNNCMCARGGTFFQAIVDLSGDIPATSTLPTPLIEVVDTITRGRFDGNVSSKVVNCLTSSDCVNTYTCEKQCKKRGVKWMAKYSECCYCFPNCENCFCRKNTVGTQKLAKGGKRGNKVTIIAPRTLPSLTVPLDTTSLTDILG